jgi:uncharacterized protein YecT (DUF1311 family)
MGQSQRGLPVTGSGTKTISSGRAIAALSAIAIGVLAGCSGSSTSTASAASTSSTAPPASAVPSASTGGTAGATAVPSAAVTFVPVTEPFDPGHPARAMSAPASCDQNSTLAIEQCFEDKTETADAAIDALRQAAFASASSGQQAAINSGDSSWLAARAPVCAKAYQTGGTIDGINIANCLLDESTARLDALKSITPPEAVLKSTDSTSLSDLSWYTTQEGSRIAMIDTQGDATGGAIVAWVIIAGADGFVVNPAQFPYRDGTFTDAGIVAGANLSRHLVAPGTEYQFTIDYSKLSADPNAGKGGGWVYAPGTPVAVWR